MWDRLKLLAWLQKRTHFETTECKLSHSLHKCHAVFRTRPTRTIAVRLKNVAIASHYLRSEWNFFGRIAGITWFIVNKNVVIIGIVLDLDGQNGGEGEGGSLVVAVNFGSECGCFFGLDVVFRDRTHSTVTQHSLCYTANANKMLEQMTRSIPIQNSSRSSPYFHLISHFVSLESHAPTWFFAIAAYSCTRSPFGILVACRLKRVAH